MLVYKLAAIELARLPAGMHADGGGLYLNVRNSGSRSWILRTTIRGKRRDIGLGGLSVMPLSEAREQAAQLRARAKKGEDIIETRRLDKHIVPTFKEIAVTYHGQLSETFGSEKHAFNWLRSLEQYVFPVFGSKTVDAIDTADVLRAIGPIWTEKSDTARRTVRRVKAIFDYAQVSGHRNIMMGNLVIPLPNPCDNIRKALPSSRTGEKHHESFSYQQLPDFIRDLRRSSAGLCVKLAFEFLILTAARTGEVLGATWDEVNLEEKVWTIPAERMKMRKQHQVPLAPRCIEILNLAKEFNDSEIVFPGRSQGHRLSNMSFLMVLRRMGHESLTSHWFRSSFKSWAHSETQYDYLIVESAMAHEVKGVEKAYMRTSFFEKRKTLIEAWSRFVTAAPAATVVNIR